LYEQVKATPQKGARPHTLINHLSSLNYRTLSIGILLTSIMAIANYFLIAYFSVFLIETQGLPSKPVMEINTIAIILQLVITLLMGRVSDYTGRKIILGIGMVSLSVLIYPIFWLLIQHNIYQALIGELLFATAAGALTGVIPTMLAEMFDTYHRNMGISISYNISLAIFGGTAPLVAMTLVAKTNNLFSPAWYLMSCSTIAFIALNCYQHKATRFYTQIENGG
jgi:proline/betaine transport protein TphA